jgi:uncharacterized protein involved in exopolysaccharide biosynthesis
LQNEGSQYFFQLNNPNLKISNIATPLSVEVLNEVAKTIKISYRDKNPEKTADVVNAIANDFISYDVENKEQSADNILHFLDDQLALLYDKLIETEEHLNDFRKRLGIVEELDGTGTEIPTGISSRNLEYLGKIDQINDLLYGVEFDIELLRKIKAEVSNDFQKVDFNKVLSGVALTQLHGAFTSQLQTLNQIQLEREKLLYDVTNNSDQVKRIDYQIKIQNRLILDGIENTIIQGERLKKDYLKKVGSYQIRIKAEADTTQNMEYDVLEYSKLKRIYSVTETFYNDLVTKKAEYSITKAGFTPNNRLLERAIVPEIPISPDKKVVIIAAIVASILLSIFLITIIFVDVLFIFKSYKLLILKVCYKNNSQNCLQ